MGSLTFPLMGFSRHRLGIDGQGVTTLAAARGCPLQCRYCLNPQCRDPKTAIRPVTPKELYEIARVDDLYFQATGGGVTFGGGEPLMHAEFIAAFRNICGNVWRVTAETCLSVPAEKIRTAAGCVDEFMVDIKDMNPGIYRKYTGAEITLTKANLKELLALVGPDRILVRVPLIPGFNTAEDTERSADELHAMGITRLDRFAYRKLPVSAE